MASEPKNNAPVTINKMISSKLPSIDSDANLVREVLENLILKQQTNKMECDLINDISLIQLLKLRFVPVLAWPMPYTILAVSPNPAK